MVLVPGAHLNIPPSGSLREKALIHGVLFAVVNYYVYKFIRPMLEGFNNPDTRINPPCPPMYEQCPSGDCRLKTDVHSVCK